ncbi:RNA polymerase factor sigma-54 [Cytophaga hutchinsonii]|jgi:RNA polymerase sigma-54 factor|uniref:RNA polymerase, sigma 54 subunit, RpoN/SigL n=1 Tax=Cytophaga hutchinsonii (strain ATCC 33406 / DSM 1761 / CIP 103989 / NBRC 15051 / NCIMB 9469 / D465) TaxID=269798 RepID=A0A6N4SVW6_CYTH3|nr:RNA polymerase factor sigma-54 [Cytophaga hutchinsonii]ABG60417.1 RNA polymerase, sigma 54 subunit, RpoN/SigL [Cytophaga hutchinsonii ATCC 33406]SFX86400.1 RNA polymerase, sigma 54 subunit, RpoN/SigL [Cytophaga hutchinsonii ATCC 33406]
MQKLSIQQQLSQKLSPQQIQFIKLLQIPAAELESRIEEELEINPALEEGKEEQAEEKDSNEEEFSDSDDDYSDDELDVQEYIRDEDVAGYKMQGDGPSQDDEERESPLAGTTSLTEMLLNQLGFLRLDERQTKIAEQLIGSIDEDGYIRRNLDLIVDDLAFSQNIETNVEEIEEVLFRIQDFDPAGIGARDLQECLLLQIERRHMDEPEVMLAHNILKDCFDEFTKKHYDKIQKKFDVDDESIKAAVNIITKLNPKPGGTSGDDIKTQYLMPDFILQTNNGELELFLNSKNAPDLRVSRNYSEMFETYDKSAKNDKKLKEAVTFVKQKLDAAKWFIEAIKQRQQTLLKTMHAILEFQKEFFFEGDESYLKPMILKDIADMVNMDISTISRVANSKAVQTEFGIYPLKYFFSEGIATDSGEDASSREVKHILKEIIDGEQKKKPLSDEKLEKELNKRGYNIARRTVAKYREQLNIPVARLRKEL